MPALAGRQGRAFRNGAPSTAGRDCGSNSCQSELLRQVTQMPQRADFPSPA